MKSLPSRWTFDFHSVPLKVWIGVLGGAVFLLILLVFLIFSNGESGSVYEDDGSSYFAVDEMWIDTGMDVPVVPEVIQIQVDQDFYFYRQPRSFWTDEEVAEYWIPVEEIGRDILNQENQQILDRIFTNIP